MTIEDFLYSRHVPTPDPYFFGRDAGASADESVIGVTCARTDAQKITHLGYRLCTTRMLNHHPASICPGNWHDIEKRLFKYAFPPIPGTA
jgi:hypothetical protein